MTDESKSGFGTVNLDASEQDKFYGAQSGTVEERIAKLEKTIAELHSILSNHRHLGLEKDKSVNLGRTQDIDAYEEFRAGNTASMTGARATSTGGETHYAYFMSGEDLNPEDGINSAQITLEHQDFSNGTTNQSFYYGYRYPLYTSTGSIKTGTSILTQTRYKLKENELIGAYINVVASDGSVWNGGQITANSKTTITVNTTWTITDSSVFWVVFMPIYLGSADYPWRRVYAAQDFRLGIGPSAGTDVVFIKHGLGSPEGVVAAPVGSLYLRRDGGSASTLYVKETGTTTSSGWSTTA